MRLLYSLLVLFVAVPVHAQEEGFGAPVVEPPPPTVLTPLMKKALDRRKNRFVGTVVMEYMQHVEGDTTTWKVLYCSTPDSCVVRGFDVRPRNRTVLRRMVVIDRARHRFTWYFLGNDGVLHSDTSPLSTRYVDRSDALAKDSVRTARRTILERECREHGSVRRGRTRRAWIDPKVPSIFWDLFSADKGWSTSLSMLRYEHMAIDDPGMPLEVEDRDGTFQLVHMKVIRLEPDAVDPALFRVPAPDQW